MHTPRKRCSLLWGSGANHWATVLQNEHPVKVLLKGFWHLTTRSPNLHGVVEAEWVQVESNSAVYPNYGWLKKQIGKKIKTKHGFHKTPQRWTRSKHYLHINKHKQWCFLQSLKFSEICSVTLAVYVDLGHLNRNRFTSQVSLSIYCLAVVMSYRFCDALVNKGNLAAIQNVDILTAGWINVNSLFMPC